MANQSKVSLAKAAKMVGVARSTFYRHIEEKNISIEDKDTKRPKVDVSELIRVYGNKVKAPDQVKNESKSKVTDKAVSDSTVEERIELQTLREKVQYLEQLHSTEKSRLEEQIDMLRDMLASEKEERKKATALLTDQRSEKDKQADRLARLEQDIDALKDRGFWGGLFGKHKKAA